MRPASLFSPFTRVLNRHNLPNARVRHPELRGDRLNKQTATFVAVEPGEDVGAATTNGGGCNATSSGVLINAVLGERLNKQSRMIALQPPQGVFEGGAASAARGGYIITSSCVLVRAVLRQGRLPNSITFSLARCDDLKLNRAGRPPMRLIKTESLFT